MYNLMLRELRNHLTSKHGQVLCKHIFDTQLSTVTLLKSSHVPDNFCLLVCSRVGSLLCLMNQICICRVPQEAIFECSIVFVRVQRREKLQQLARCTLSVHILLWQP